MIENYKEKTIIVLKVPTPSNSKAKAFWMGICKEKRISLSYTCSYQDSRSILYILEVIKRKSNASMHYVTINCAPPKIIVAIDFVFRFSVI